MRSFPLCLLPLALPLTTSQAISPPSNGRSDPPNWQAGVNVFAESGDYGTELDTTLTYVPFSLRRYFTYGDIQLTIPFLSVITEGNVTIIEGSPEPNPQDAVQSRETTNGLGDIVLRGRYYLVPEGPRIPQIDLAPKIKFPTASRRKNLGTGEYDGGGSVEITKIFLERYVALGDAGYTVIGDPPGEDLNDRWHYSLGGGYFIRPQKWDAYIIYDERRALIDGISNPRSLVFYTEVRTTSRLKFNGGIEVGLSRTAPDYGLTVGSRLAF